MTQNNLHSDWRFRLVGSPAWHYIDGKISAAGAFKTARAFYPTLHSSNFVISRLVHIK